MTNSSSFCIPLHGRPHRRPCYSHCPRPCRCCFSPAHRDELLGRQAAAGVAAAALVGGNGFLIYPALPCLALPSFAWMFASHGGCVFILHPGVKWCRRALLLGMFSPLRSHLLAGRAGETAERSGGRGGRNSECMIEQYQWCPRSCIVADIRFLRQVAGVKAGLFCHATSFCFSPRVAVCNAL